MKARISLSNTVLVLSIWALLSSAPALAASAQKSVKKQEDQHSHNEDRMQKKVAHFDAARREKVGNYYKGKQGGAACPPGLAKKANACVPPGQAKKWQLSQPLPADIRYQPLPRELQILLGQAPAGQHYGMIDEDILLLANVTELVLEVITGQ